LLFDIVFDHPIGEGEGLSWPAGGFFGVIRKPIPTFPKPVYKSDFDISINFLTNRLDIACVAFCEIILWRHVTVLKNSLVN